MKILVCGGRDYDNWGRVNKTLTDYHMIKPITCVIHGAASGADSLGAEWATLNKIEAIPYEAQWDVFGKSAGPRRNIEMLEDNPDIELCIAFAGGAGTNDMINRAKAAKIKVIKVP